MLENLFMLAALTIPLLIVVWHKPTPRHPPEHLRRGARHVRRWLD